jgi:hypothetical protein
MMWNPSGLHDYPADKDYYIKEITGRFHFRLIRPASGNDEFGDYVQWCVEETGARFGVVFVGWCVTLKVIERIYLRSHRDNPLTGLKSPLAAT